MIVVEQEPVHRALLSVDIEGSGGRDSTASVIIRQALFAELRKAFEASGVDWDSCVRQDTGDGMIVVAPEGCSKRRLVHPLLPALAEGLAHHNRYGGQATRIRVRAAIHAGDLRVDPHGLTGKPKVLLARLLNAGPLREALTAAPGSTVAVLVSDSFHDDVITEGHPGIDPATYTPVAVREKETEVRAWLHVVGGATTPPTPEPPAPASTPAERTPSGGVVISGSSQVSVNGDLFGGNKFVR
jgi:class 3 adenylate cyclase